MQLQHIERAHRLMSIFDGIRETFRTSDLPEASDGAAATQVARAGVDRDLAGCPSVAGTKTTEIARRMLFKATATDNPGEYKCHTTRVWSLFTKKEQEKVGRVSVYVFRDIAKACPPALGRFDDKLDSIIFTVPDELTDEWHACLLDFANTKQKSLEEALKMVGKKGGARRANSGVGEAAATAGA